PPPLPAGTYPDWSQDKVYDRGDRVQFKGFGYRAKWWARGDEPGADADNPWDTPWELMATPTDIPTTTTTTIRPPGTKG
ncbi:MAG TPA: carbohydrate-binding protein, partial [Acidimicrobiia bacterium]|nr:carbohydrate-binding protein [Acidimicrobiia bacterium]